MKMIKHPFSMRVGETDIGYDYRRKVGKHVRELREKAGLTQRELARAVGVTSNMISAIELGRNPIPPERYRSFTEALSENPKKFGIFLLEYTDPWLFGLIHGEAAVAGHNLGGIVSRVMGEEE